MTEQSEGRIRIAVIIGSARTDSYTGRVAQILAQDLGRYPEVSVDLVDPREAKLFAPGYDPDEAASALKDRIDTCTAVVLATPEYHGSFSAVMKLVIENLGFPSALKGKPVALLGVASGRIGAIKALEHLRSVCSHVGAIVLPGPVSIARVTSLFDDAGQHDPEVETSVQRLSDGLVAYINKAICPAMELEAMVRENES